MTTPSSAAKALIEAALAWYVCECPAEVTHSYDGCVHQAELVETISAYRASDPTGSILARQAAIGEALEPHLGLIGAVLERRRRDPVWPDEDDGVYREALAAVAAALGEQP